MDCLSSNVDITQFIVKVRMPGPDSCYPLFGNIIKLNINDIDDVNRHVNEYNNEYIVNSDINQHVNTHINEYIVNNLDPIINEVKKIVQLIDELVEDNIVTKGDRMLDIGRVYENYSIASTKLLLLALQYSKYVTRILPYKKGFILNSNNKIGYLPFISLTSRHTVQLQFDFDAGLMSSFENLVIDDFSSYVKFWKQNNCVGSPCDYVDYLKPHLET